LRQKQREREQGVGFGIGWLVGAVSFTWHTYISKAVSDGGALGRHETGWFDSCNLGFRG
jgi:hypothetical protein